MVVCLIIGVFLIQNCERTVEEDLKVTLNYSHPRQQEYPEANYRYFSQRPVLVHKHYIDVKDFNQKHLYDSTTLDNDLT